MPTRDSTPTGAPCWIELFTSDPDKTQAFYNELFGWTCESAGEEYGGYFNFTKDGRAVAGGMKNDGSEGAHDAWAIYLAVDDAEKAAESATSNGGGVVVPPMPVMALGSMMVVTDAGGAVVGGWQPNEFNGLEVYGEPGTPAWFELWTRDHAKAVAFYEKVFGWTLDAVGDSDEFRYSILVEGDEQLAGIMDASSFLPDGVPAHWSVYFGTDNADKTIEKVVELGGSVVVPAEDTPYGRLATVADPTGINFKLVQPPEAA